MITEKWIKEAIPELRRLDIAILEKVALLESLNKQTNLRFGNRKRAARSKRPNTPSDGFKNNGVHTSN